MLGDIGDCKSLLKVTMSFVFKSILCVLMFLDLKCKLCSPVDLRVLVLFSFSMANGCWDAFRVGVCILTNSLNR